MFESEEFRRLEAMPQLYAVCDECNRRGLGKKSLVQIQNLYWDPEMVAWHCRTHNRVGMVSLKQFHVRQRLPE